MRNEAESSARSRKTSAPCSAVLALVAAAAASLAAQRTANGRCIPAPTAPIASRRSKQITTDNVAKLRPAWVYQPPGTGIDRVDACRRQRRHVHDVRTDDGGGSGSQERQAAVGMDAADCAERAEPRFSARQPRRGRARQHGLRRHARWLSVRARCQRGDRALVGSCRREPDRPFDHRRTARRRRQGDRRASAAAKPGSAGSSTPTMPRPASWCGASGPCPHRASRAASVARRQLGPRRRRNLADRFVRSGAQAALLGYRQPGS